MDYLSTYHQFICEKIIPKIIEVLYDSSKQATYVMELNMEAPLYFKGKKLQHMIGIIQYISEKIDFAKVRKHAESHRGNKLFIPIRLQNPAVARGYTETTLETHQALALITRAIKA